MYLPDDKYLPPEDHPLSELRRQLSDIGQLEQVDRYIIEAWSEIYTLRHDLHSAGQRYRKKCDSFHRKSRLYEQKIAQLTGLMRPGARYPE